MTKKWLGTLGGFWAFFGFGFVDNLKGPLLPEMVRSGRLDYAQAGSLIFASYMGFIVATLGSGALADRVSHRTVLWLAAWCLLGGLLSIGLCSAFTALSLCMFAMGLGMGAIELGANGLMIQLHSRDRGRYLNLLSVFHGCGSLIVPLAAAQLIDLSWNWQSIYAVCAVLAIPVALIFWPGQTGDGQTDGGQAGALEEADVSRESASHWLRDGFTLVMWYYYALIATYVAVELSIGAWLMEYLQQQHELSVDSSSRYLSAFFVMIMLGRLLGAWVVERVDYLSAVAIALVATAVCITVGLIDRAWVFLLPVSGLCMSIIFPTITASVSRLHPVGGGKIIGMLFAFGGLGGACGPWIVGLVSQSFGLHTGMWTTLIFNALAILFVAILVAKRRFSERERR